MTQNEVLEDIRGRATDLSEAISTAVHKIEQGVAKVNTLFNTESGGIPFPSSEHEQEEKAIEDDPLLTERQKCLLGYYDLFGIGGLADCINEIAEREYYPEADDNSDPDHSDDNNVHGQNVDKTHGVKKGHSSWKLIMDDFQTGVEGRIYFYLASLAPDMIRALIRGDLPRRMRDPEFQIRFGPHLTCRSSPGVYSIYVARTCPTRSSQLSADDGQHAGRGLSLRQLNTVVELMREYMDLDSVNSVSLAKNIDTQKGEPSLELDYRNQRRYGGGGDYRVFEIHRKWLDHVERNVLEDYRRQLGTSQEHMLDVPLQRCLPYVGSADDTLSGAVHHWTHEGRESPLYGLYTAVISFAFGEQFNVQDYTYQVFKTTRIEDIELNEKLVTTLLSGDPWDGGLCYTHAGPSESSSAERDTMASPEELESNAMSIQNSGFLDESIKDFEDKISRVQDFLEATETREARLETFRQTASRRVEELNDLQSSVTDLIQELEAIENQLVLQKEYQEFMEEYNKFSTLKALLEE